MGSRRPPSRITQFPHGSFRASVFLHRASAIAARLRTWCGKIGGAARADFLAKISWRSRFWPICQWKA